MLHLFKVSQESTCECMGCAPVGVCTHHVYARHPTHMGVHVPACTFSNGR